MKAQSNPHPSLWQQLHAVATVVAAVGNGVSGTAALEAAPLALRAGVQALVFQVWRNAGRAQALRRQLAPKRPPPLVDALLCSALALMASDTGASESSDASYANYDVFTLVNQTVEAAKRTPATRASANFINACLRRFLRERDTLLAAIATDLVAVWNYPAWWIARVQRDHPSSWQAILQAGNQRAPMTLRVNCQKTSVSDYLALLESAGIQAQALSTLKTPATLAGSAECAIILDKSVPVQKLPHFADGWVSVQDAAAQIAAPLLINALNAMSATLQGQGLRILDACAAPGGKTGHLLELIPNNKVLALEIDKKRIPRIHENLARLGLSAKIQVADAAQIATWWDGRLFDAILLDAPCSASGIVRRHPDVRWLRRETDIAQLAALQAEILPNLWTTLRAGGRLVYCTCSVFRAEGSEQIQNFLAHHADAVLLPSVGHCIAHEHYDGFYYALLEKKKVAGDTANNIAGDVAMGFGTGG